MPVAMPLAIVGSGAIADYYYFPVLAAYPHLRANTWIVEPAIDRGVKAAEKFGFRKDQVLGRIDDLPPSIRLAVNATPSHLHRGTTVALIERDISVLVEKPFAENAEDARAMIAAAEGKAILTANHFRRLTPSYAFVRDFIASGQLGEVRKVTWPRATNSIGRHNRVSISDVRGQTAARAARCWISAYTSSISFAGGWTPSPR